MRDVNLETVVKNVRKWDKTDDDYADVVNDVMEREIEENRVDHVVRNDMDNDNQADAIDMSEWDDTDLDLADF